MSAFFLMKSEIRNLQSAILVIGQGLAGTAVAWRLFERGVPFVIVDAGELVTSSKIAAGLISPITGQKLALSWRIAELMPVAEAFYDRVETTLDVKFLHRLPHVRLFKEQREVDLWKNKRVLDPALQPWLIKDAPLADDAAFHTELGGFVQRAAWLDTARYLEASRVFFDQHACYQQGTVAEDDLVLEADSVRWREQLFSNVIFCRGWQQAQQSRFFPWLPFASARGVIASLQGDLMEERIVNRGAWLLPRGEGSWRAGSTYEFDFSAPLERSTDELKTKLRDVLKRPFELSEAQAAIRPVIKHKPLALGRHPVHERIALLNGLGSKGVLRAPFFAQMLVNHLLDDAMIDNDLDVRGNW